NNYLYKEIPLISESQYDRIHRLIQYKKLIEINPLIEYGSYQRETYATTGELLLSQSAQHVLFYSVYSSYRDAGAIKPPTQNQETYFDLAFAPFQPKYLFNPYFLIPIGALLVFTGYETMHPPKNPDWTLLYPGMKRSGYMGFYVTTISFNAGVSEEAFFRGFLNHFLIKNYDEIIEISGKLPDKIMEDKTIIFYIAKAYYEKKQYSQAIILFSKLIEKVDNFKEKSIFAIYIGNCNAYLGNYSTAKFFYKQALLFDKEQTYSIVNNQILEKYGK
ncbi:MAG: hypothetical protein WH035_02755, partial [Spirochaetota bacterium]